MAAAAAAGGNDDRTAAWRVSTSWSSATAWPAAIGRCGCRSAPRAVPPSSVRPRCALCMHVYTCMHAHMYARMHVCTYARMHVCKRACMQACMHAHTHTRPRGPPPAVLPRRAAQPGLTLNAAGPPPPPPLALRRRLRGLLRQQRRLHWRRRQHRRRDRGPGRVAAGASVATPLEGAHPPPLGDGKPARPPPPQRRRLTVL